MGKSERKPFKNSVHVSVNAAGQAVCANEGQSQKKIIDTMSSATEYDVHGERMSRISTFDI